MTDPRELLDAYAAQIPPITALEPREHAAPKAFAALRAVLDLHRPITPRAPQDVAAECAECYDISAAPWPCRTAQAITLALEVTEP